MVLAGLRDQIARRLLEKHGAVFGLEVDCPAAAIPEYADALFIQDLRRL